MISYRIAFDKERRIMTDDMLNPDVDYDSLEQHTYDDTPGEVFYTCRAVATSTLGHSSLTTSAKPCA